MSPRPVEFPESGFTAALHTARSGRPADALDEVRTALAGLDHEANSGHAATACGEIARLAEEKGEWGVAERALEFALRLKPQYADLHFRHAEVLQRSGRRAEARKALDAALRINPRYVAARVERALLDARDGLIGESLESLRGLSRDATVDDPQSFQRAIQSLELADWDEATTFLRRALRLDDARLEARLQGIRGHLEAGDAACAVQSLRALVPEFGAYPDLHALLGRAELALGHADDAMVSLSRALELNPEFHAARVLLAQTLDSLGLADQADEQIGMILQSEPDQPAALEFRARAARVVRTRRSAG